MGLHRKYLKSKVLKKPGTAGNLNIDKSYNGSPNIMFSTKNVSLVNLDAGAGLHNDSSTNQCMFSKTYNSPVKQKTSKEYVKCLMDSSRNKQMVSACSRVLPPHTTN